MVGGDDGACPACGTAVAGEPWCGSCGLELQGRNAEELRLLAAQLAATEVELKVIGARRAALADQLATRRWAHGLHAATEAPTMPHEQPTHHPTAVPASPEWNLERVRNVLLWTGVALLAFAALAFTAVAWTHLGSMGRAELLITITLVAAAAAVATSGRLPATSGALTGLTIALALIDWQIARRAGAASGLSDPTWWAIGTAAVAAASLELGRLAAPLPAHRAVAVLAPASAVLTLTSAASSAWGIALGLSVLAGGLVGIDRLTSNRVVDPVVRALLHIEASISWVVGAAFVAVAAVEPHTFAQTFTPAAVMAALVVAPGVALSRSIATARHRGALASVVLAVPIGIALTLASTSVGLIGSMTLAAVLGATLMAVAPSLSAVWRRAALRIGSSAAVSGVVFAVSVAFVAELSPSAWLGHAWTGTMTSRASNVIAGPHARAASSLGWCAVAILAAVAVAIPLAVRARRGTPTAWTHEWRVLAVGVALLSLMLVCLASGGSALVACVVATTGTLAAVVGAAVATRRHPHRALPYGLLAVVPAVPALGWAALTATASISVLASVALAALIATGVGRVSPLRAAHAALGAAVTATLAAVIALAAGASVPSAGFTAGTVAGVLLLTGSQARRDTADGTALEWVGGLGILVGVVLASHSAAWTAGTCTAVVPLLLAARLRGHRTVLYAAFGAVAALTATWAWFAAAGVSVAEAYTLPAAAVAIFAARLADRDGPARSWLHYGPALALFLGPTLMLAIVRHDDTRAIVVGLASLTVVLIGARQQLQAPIVLGALTLVVLALDKLGPTAVRLPRWIMLAFCGSLLLWVGSTFERRRDDAQRAVRRFERLG
jgi:hypothetical protein